MGDTFPTGPSPVFPPNRWECPKNMGGCGKTHNKPHYPWPGQVDFSKKPGEVGRVTFNRADENDNLKGDTPTKQEYVGKQAPMYQKGKLQPLFCPHCGWTLDGVVLVMKKMRKKRAKKPTQNEEKTFKEKIEKRTKARPVRLSEDVPAPAKKKKKGGIRSMLDRVGIRGKEKK